MRTSMRGAMPEKVERPKPHVTENGFKVVYPIWRDDLAEAIVFMEEKCQQKSSEKK